MKDEETNTLLEKQKKPEEETFKLLTDFYALTYVSYLKKWEVSEDRKQQNFFNCVIIFSMQAVLSFLVGQQIFLDTSQLVVADFKLFCARFICTIMLHIQLEPEIRQGIDMLRYMYYYP